jgi:CubicO group peptidase (beta-lactamase class C family)
VTEHLARAAGLALEHGAGGFLVAKRERVIYEAGDVSAVINCRSIRKSLLNVVVGRAVAARQLDLDATLAELGIDDAVEPGLTASERRARVRDLLTCRSGVYHPANHAGGPAAFATLPRRGSHRPGEWFYYNNWDFNALGTIVNQALGRSLFDEFAEVIAQPAGMEDFDPAQQRYARQPYSEHATYSFRISTRDLARFGQLYLRGGRERAVGHRRAFEQPALVGDPPEVPVARALRGDRLNPGAFTHPIVRNDPPAVPAGDDRQWQADAPGPMRRKCCVSQGAPKRKRADRKPHRLSEGQLACFVHLHADDGDLLGV